MSTAALKRLGVIVPSSNTVAEAGTLEVLGRSGGISAHFTRLRVTGVADDDGSRTQFDEPRFRDAAGLLADADVGLILWSGTSSAWLGWRKDRRVTDTIAAHCGIPSMTATTAINARLERIGATSIGLVSPYVEAIESSIVRNYREIGIDVAAAERLDLTVGTDYGKVDPSVLSDMAARVAKSAPDAIVILCTNLNGAPVVDPVRSVTGIPVLDSVRVAAEEAVVALTELEELTV